MLPRAQKSRPKWLNNRHKEAPAREASGLFSVPVFVPVLDCNALSVEQNILHVAQQCSGAICA